MSKLGQELIKSMEEAAAYMRGEAVNVIVHTPAIAAMDIKNTREKLKLSQPQFAHLLGTPLPTLQKWEQGKRHPSGAAQRLLKVIDTEPEAVLRALKVA